MSLVFQPENRTRLLVLTVIASIMFGCAGRVYTPTDVPIKVPETVTLLEFGENFARAAEQLAWQTEVKEAGVVLATRRWGGSGNKHNMTVRVNYDREKFSINYVNSKLLGYNGERIHGSYRRFVRQLEGIIVAEAERLDLYARE